MALRTIIREGDPALRKKCKLVENFDQRLHTLLDDLADTMRHAEGVGLASPQVAVLRRAVVIDIGEGLLELVNPVIVYESAEGVEEAEGCLSSPGEYGMVIRPKKVVAKYFDRYGKAHEITGEGFLARAICHELDHLDGKLFKDIVTSMLDPYEV